MTLHNDSISTAFTINDAVLCFTWVLHKRIKLYQQDAQIKLGKVKGGRNAASCLASWQATTRPKKTMFIRSK